MSGSWTTAANQKLAEELTDRSGQLGKDRFVEYFSGKLPPERDRFDDAVLQMLQCAVQCRQEAERMQIDQQRRDNAAANKLKELLGPTDRPQSAAAAFDARERQLALSELYRQLCQNGQLTAQRLLLVGKQRRLLSQKSRNWGSEANDAMLDLIGAADNESIPEIQFVRYMLQRFEFIDNFFEQIDQILVCCTSVDNTNKAASLASSELQKAHWVVNKCVDRNLSRFIGDPPGLDPQVAIQAWTESAQATNNRGSSLRAQQISTFSARLRHGMNAK